VSAALPPEEARLGNAQAEAAPSSRPVLHHPPELLLRGQDVRIAFFDVDGVLTDGGIYMVELPAGDPRGATETFKRFNTLDGLGLKLLMAAGITPAIVTGRDSVALRTRLNALGIVHARFGTENKLPAATDILEQLGLGWHQAATIGDDWPDLPLLTRSALACAPPQAHIEVRAAAHHVTTAAGGHGAAREFCDLLLTATGHYAALLAEYRR
jgi:3-deoxy-D-manno-octulosonate 8-phosphate phosphatase (KDO 8-P phosphatase)